MSDIKQYFLTLTVAALLGSIVLSISNKISSQTAIIKLLVGIFLSITVISPLLSFQFDSWDDILEGVKYDSSNIVQNSADTIKEEYINIISTQVSTYICDKANEMNVSPEVQVVLSETHPYKPVHIQITAICSPYEKSKLQQMIESDLGIPTEDQVWN